MSGWVAVLLPLLLAYAPSLWWCAEMWWLDDGYYSHGPLVPIVMAVSADAVEMGLVASFARPGGNLTGSSW